MAYTVKQLAQLAGVSVRTLHHYDEIGLLIPPVIGANGYRYYDERSTLRLQGILCAARFFLGSNLNPKTQNPKTAER